MKPGIYYKYRSEAEQARLAASCMYSGGGWYVCNCRVAPRKTYGWIVCRTAVGKGFPAVQIVRRDGSLVIAEDTYDGYLREVPCDF